MNVYITKLRRLAAIAKLGETVIKRAFIMGLPCSVGKVLRATPQIEAIPLLDLVSKTRALIATEKGS